MREGVGVGVEEKESVRESVEAEGGKEILRERVDV